MKKIIALSTLLALSALGMACGGTTVAPNNATNKPPASPAASPAATTPSNSTAGSTDSADSAKIGVASCDEYLAEMDKYLANPKVPEAVKTAQKNAKENYLKAWKAAAATPEGKAGLDTGCKAALESVKNLPKM